MIEVVPLETKSSTAATARVIRENETQQERLRAKLARMGGELKPQRSARRNLLLEPADIWGLRTMAKWLRIDVKSAPGELANSAARGVVHALESCGFKTRVTRDCDSPWDGVHVESRAEEAAVALLIQSAFRTAGLGAGLTIHDRAAARRVVVHVGPNALS